MQIRPAVADDHPTLLSVWLRSVRQTHTFLSEADIQFYLPLVRDYALPQLELWVLMDEPRGVCAGFLGLIDNKLEALFVAPEYMRQGGGRALVEHARRLKGPLLVDVNEQNPEAVAFYRALGFRQSGRSPLDSSGRPFPLLHLSDDYAAEPRGATAGDSHSQPVDDQFR